MKRSTDEIVYFPNWTYLYYRYLEKSKKKFRSFVFWENLRHANLLTVLSDLYHFPLPISSSFIRLTLPNVQPEYYCTYYILLPSCVKFSYIFDEKNIWGFLFMLYSKLYNPSILNTDPIFWQLKWIVASKFNVKSLYILDGIENSELRSRMISNFSLVFWSKWWLHKDILKLTDL